jgi:hypothetical protein
MEHSSAMALTQVGCEVRLRLPRWDRHLLERLDAAGIGTRGAPDHHLTTPLEATLLVPAETLADAHEQVMRTLRGWTVLLRQDFLT